MNFESIPWIVWHWILIKLQDLYRQFSMRQAVQIFRPVKNKYKKRTEQKVSFLLIRIKLTWGHNWWPVLKLIVCLCRYVLSYFVQITIIYHVYIGNDLKFPISTHAYNKNQHTNIQNDLPTQFFHHFRWPLNPDRFVFPIKCVWCAYQHDCLNRLTLHYIMDSNLTAGY